MQMANIASSIGAGIQNFAGASARAASRANEVSAAAQSAQGNFNAGQAAIANNIGADRIAEQYAFNAAQAASANQFTSDMWDRAAAWNEAMFERQMEFNSKEAQKNRDWVTQMENTKYQRAIGDMKSAGLNPVLAVTGGGISVGSGGGGAASASAPTMSGATGQSASGGLLNGISASEGNYSGQMEYMGGTLGLLSAAIGGISSALQAFGGLGKFGEQLAKILLDKFVNDDTTDTNNNKKGGKSDIENRNNIKNRRLPDFYLPGIDQ